MATGLLSRCMRQFGSPADVVTSSGLRDKFTLVRSGFIQRFASLPEVVETTMENGQYGASSGSSLLDLSMNPRIKTKKLTKVAQHIMELLDREAVDAAKKERAIPNFSAGDTLQIKVEVPENKRRVSVLKGLVIARRNAGIGSTFRIRRALGGTGVEMVFPLYSPSIKEIKVLERKKMRRAKLYYLREKFASSR